jgi:hypothetical protein
MALLKKKIMCQCPCGYCFETLSSENNAVVMIQLHFESFHRDFLPFGITDAEALKLLKVGYEEQTGLSSRAVYSAQTESTLGSKDKTGTVGQPKRKKQLIAH